MGASTIAATPSADITALSTEVLEAEVVGLAGRIAAASAQLLGLIAELDRRSAWGTWGCRSMAHWLSWHAGIDIGAAREQVCTARTLEVLALTAERFGRGELSSARLPSEGGTQFLAGLASAAEALSSATIGTDHGQRHADPPVP